MRGSWLVILLIVVSTALVVMPPFWGGGRVRGGGIWFTVWGLEWEDRLFRDEYARGYEALSGVHVRYARLQPQELIQKYNAWHAAGRGPEVMRLPITEYHGMVARGMLEPLTAFMDRDGFDELDDFPAHIMEILWVDGQLFGLPEDNSQYGLFYNKSIFDAHNAAHPESPIDYPSEAWTWEDLREAARRLTTYDEAGGIEIAGVEFQLWSWPFLNFFAQAGGECWSEDGLTCTVNSEAGVRTLEFFRAMEREDRSMRVTIGRLSPTGPETKFASGRTAMYFDGSWRVPDLEKKVPELDFAVAPPTGGPEWGRPAVVTGSVVWGISSRAADKEAGWRFLRWLVAPEQAAAYWDKLRVAPPARLSVLESASFRSTAGIVRSDGTVEVPPMPQERFKERAAWLAYGTTPHPETGRPPGFIPVGIYQADLELELLRMLESWLNPSNQETAKEVLDRVVSNVHAIIDRDRAARGLPPVSR